MDSVEIKLSSHQEHDGYMPNVYPPRKMFSSTPQVAGGLVSEDNHTGGMITLKKLAEAIEKDGKLHVPND